MCVNEVNDSDIKVSDFGLAIQLQSGEKSHTFDTLSGSFQYLAPETLLKKKYSPASDMWAVGLIMYILLCGYPPFYAETREELKKKIVAGEIEFEDKHWSKISESAKELVRKMLKINPEERISAEEALKHPWVTQEAASSATTIDVNELKQFNAKRRFRSATRSIIAANRISSILGK